MPILPNGSPQIINSRSPQTINLGQNDGRMARYTKAQSSERGSRFVEANRQLQGVRNSIRPMLARDKSSRRIICRGVETSNYRQTNPLSLARSPRADECICSGKARYSNRSIPPIAASNSGACNAEPGPPTPRRECPALATDSFTEPSVLLVANRWTKQ